MIALSRLRSGLSRASAPEFSRATLSPAVVCTVLELVLAAAGVSIGMRSGQFPDTLGGLIGALILKASTVVAAAYDKAPALVMVLIALLVVPAAAIGGLIVDVIWSRRAQRRTAPQVPLTTLATSEPVRVETGGDAPWPARAQLFIAGSDKSPITLAAPVVRIGRHEENDVRLTDPSVHRYHAIIHRTPEAGCHISDLSGATGNGVLVNGVRCERHRLGDGDAITLGSATLKFSMRPL